MAHAPFLAGNRSPDPLVLERWLRDPERQHSADRLTDSTWQESLRGVVLGHVEVCLGRLRRAERVQGWLAHLVAGVALVACNGLALLAFGTAIAADASGALLPFGLSPSIGRIIPLLIATVPAYVFSRLLRLASACVSARQRELRECEARYLAYASAIISGRDDVLDRAIGALLDNRPDDGRL